MKQFDLYEPTSISEATGFLNQFGAKAKVVAGGSDLLGGVMKDWVTGKGMPLPDQIIDLTTIPDLKGIKSGADGYHIGATTTLTELIEHQELSTKVPLLGESAQSVPRRLSATSARWVATSTSVRGAGSSAVRTSPATRRVATSATPSLAIIASTRSSAVSCATSSIRQIPRRRCWR